MAELRGRLLTSIANERAPCTSGTSAGSQADQGCPSAVAGQLAHMHQLAFSNYAKKSPGSQEISSRATPPGTRHPHTEDHLPSGRSLSHTAPAASGFPSTNPAPRPSSASASRHALVLEHAGRCSHRVPAPTSQAPVIALQRDPQLLRSDPAYPDRSWPRYARQPPEKNSSSPNLEAQLDAGNLVG